MQRFLEILLSNAVLAAIPAVLALILARVWRRPALTHALWLLALLKLVTPPLLHVPVKVLSAVPVATVETDVAVDETIPTADTAPIAEPVRPHLHVSWTTVLLCLWGGGSVIVLSVIIGRLRRFNRLLDLSIPAPRAVQAHAKQVAQHLSITQCPRVRLLPGALSPMLWALGSRASLLLPTDLWRKLTADQRSALLAHELAHYKRRDHWVRCLELLASVVYWWHPLIWLARRELREAEEQCCDAWVVHVLPDHARAYATALLDTVDFISQTDIPLPPAASGIGNIKDLKRRLVMIMQAAHPRRLSSAGRIAVLAFGLVVLPALPRLVAEEPRAAKTDANQSVKELRGILTKTDESTLILSVGEAGSELKVPTDGDTKVFIDGAAAKLSDLKPEMFLTIRQSEGITTRVDARSARGAVKFGGGEVRRDGERPQGEVRRDGDAPKRENVARDGDRPREGGARDGERPKEVARDGERPREGVRDGERPKTEVRRDGEAPRGENVSREVKSNILRGRVDRVIGDDAIQFTGGEGREGFKLPLDNKTRIFVDGKLATLADVKPGMMVTAHRFEELTVVVEARTMREPNRRAGGEGERPRNADQPRGEGERPKNGDQPRGEGERPRNGDQPR